MAERPCAERVTGDPHPLDEVPSAPASQEVGYRRGSCAPTGAPGPFRAPVTGPLPAVRPGRTVAAEFFPVPSPAGAHRLILLGVSRI